MQPSQLASFHHLHPDYENEISQKTSLLTVRLMAPQLRWRMFMDNTVTKPLEIHTAAALQTPTDLDNDSVAEVSVILRHLLADVFVLYVKTKNFHWHMSGPHFREYHLMLDEHAEQIFAMTDDVAERARKIGGITLHSIGDIAQHQRLADNDRPSVPPHAMLTELVEDNVALTRFLREAHEVCDSHSDFATTSLIENWIDQTERRTWFLWETLRSVAGG